MNVGGIRFGFLGGAFWAVLVVAILLAMLARPAQAEADRRPNVVVIMADDLDIGSLDTMLNEGLLPNIKSELVDKGIRFPNFFATNPICAPSRATLLTGQYSHNHRVHHNSDGTGGGITALNDKTTLPVWLRAGGYRTGHVGKYLNGYGVATEKTYVPPGWDDWQGLIDYSTYRVYDYEINDNGAVATYGSAESDYQTDVLAGRAVDFINESSDSTNAGKPFFLVVTPLAPHVEITSGTPVSPWAWTIRPAPRHAGSADHLALPRPPAFNEEDVSDKPKWVQGHPKLTNQNIADLERQYRDRLASLRGVDDLVGKVFEALRQHAALERTVVFFTSDNGYLFGEHRLPQKMYAYEESIRIPFFVRLPNSQGPREIARIGLNNDLAPTIVDLAGGAAAGVVPTRVMDGRSLLPAILQPLQTPARKRFLVEHWKTTPLSFFEMPRFSAVRTGPLEPIVPNRLYTEYPSSGEREYYDLNPGADPYELDSRHADPATVAEQYILKQSLRQLRKAKGAVARYVEDR